MTQNQIAGEIGAEEAEMISGLWEEQLGVRLPAQIIAGMVGALPQLRRPMNIPSFPPQFQHQQFQPYPQQQYPQRQMTMRGGRACNMQPLQQCTANAELPLPFDSVTNITVAAGQTPVTTRPQAPFQPFRIAVAQTIAPFFIFNDIKIGTRSQMSGTGALPAEMFSNISVGVTTKMEMADTSQDITLLVVNIDPNAAAHRFIAGMLGEYCY